MAHGGDVAGMHMSLAYLLEEGEVPPPGQRVVYDLWPDSRRCPPVFNRTANISTPSNETCHQAPPPTPFGHH